MKKEFLIKSLNVSSIEALTLEKAEDRVEFEALLSLSGDAWNACDDKCTVYCAATDFGSPSPGCDPMTPTDPPPVPDPTPVPCPELK